MFKKYLLIFLIIASVQSCYALSVELDYTTLAPEQTFLGYIELDPGVYSSNSEIKVSTAGSSDTKKLKDLIDCDEIDCTGVIDYYTSGTAASTTITGSDILTGIRIPENIISISNARFDIENSDSDYPDTPIIDVGNDDDPEWIYPGYALDQFPPFFSGPQIPDPIGSVRIQSTGNCQKLLLKKSMKYQIQAFTKQTATMGIFIHGISPEETDCSDPPATQDWGWTTCNIEVKEPIETDYYHVCLTSPSSGNYIAFNSTAQNPQGYAGCSSFNGCQPVDGDYVIQAKAAEYITALRTKESYNQSNTRQEYFSRTLANHYLDCAFHEGYCTIPIKVTSKNNKSIKLSNLEYEVRTTHIIKKNEFSLDVNKVEAQGLVTIPGPILISLSKFDTEAPSDLDEYELKIEFGSETEIVDYNVAEIPTPKISISKEKVAVFEQVSFDASQSTSPDDNPLIFKWDFGDNRTGTGMLTTHYYLEPGTYTIKLTVIDTKDNISSMPTEKIIQVYSSEVEINQLLDSTLHKIDRAVSYMGSAPAPVKEIYTDLSLDTKLTQAKLTLTTYKGKLSTLSPSQLQNIRSDTNEMLATLPSRISITQISSITYYLSHEDLNEIYPDETSNFKETLRDLNSRISKKTEAKSLRFTYLSDNTENYILVEKTITPKNVLKDISLIELIPKTLGTPEFFNLEPEITTSTSYIEAKIPFNTLDSSTPIFYKLHSANLDLIKNTKTIILPSDLREKDIAFECGNDICNPAEDYITCPEDCSCGDRTCQPDENKQNCPQDCKKSSLFLIIFLILLFLAAIFGLVYYAKKNPEFAEKLKIKKLLKKLQGLIKRNPFSSEAELKRITTFIKHSKENNVPILKIRKALADKGWSQDKVNYAVKKVNSSSQSKSMTK